MHRPLNGKGGLSGDGGDSHWPPIETHFSLFTGQFLEELSKFSLTHLSILETPHSAALELCKPDWSGNYGNPLLIYKCFGHKHAPLYPTVFLLLN